MPNLAGYDIIVEIARQTCQDMINQEPIKLPPDGREVYLFGGPFPLWLAVDLPVLAQSVNLNTVCEARFMAQRGTDNCIVEMEMRSMSIQFSTKSIKRVSGRTSSLIPLRFKTPPNSPSGTSSKYYPAAVLPSSQTTFTFNNDDGSKSRVEAEIGVETTATLQREISGALDNFLRSKGDKIGNGFGFQVVPHKDSHNPQQLSAVPVIKWIDDETLGVFGYYRKEAIGGDVHAKNDSDIVQAQPEYLNVDTRLFGPVPVQANRFAVLMSAQGFKQSVSCPTIRNQFAREAVKEREKPRFIAEERKNNADHTNKVERENFFKYYNEEIAQGADSQQAYDRATVKMHADMEKRFSNAAEKPVNDYLNTHEAQLKIDAAFPRPCGTGATPKLIKMPSPFSDMIASIQWLDINLGDNHLHILVQARGDLPICGELDAEIPIEIKLRVNQAGQIQSELANSAPGAEVGDHTLCGIALAALLTYFGGAFLAGWMSYLTFRIAEEIAEVVVNKLLQERIQVPQVGVADSLVEQGKLIDIRIQPDGLTLLGLIPNDVAHANQFTSQILLKAEQVSALPSTTRAVEEGFYHKEKTCSDGQAGQFIYTRYWFDEVWRVRLKSISIPLPLSVNDWTIELGYRTPRSLSTDRETGLIGSTWSGVPVELIASQTTLSGNVYYEAPPMDGEVRDRKVTLNTTPLSDFDWRIGTQADDGNYQLRIQVAVTDGEGKKHLVQKTIDVNGESISFGADFDQEQEACIRKLEEALHKLPPKERALELPSWVKVWDPEIMHAVQVQIAMRQKHASALPLLQDGIERFGSGFQQRVQSLPALPPKRIRS